MREKDLGERKCPVCGKVFFPYPMHVYKDQRDLGKKVCSYHCARASERLKEEEKQARRERKQLERAMA